MKNDQLGSLRKSRQRKQKRLATGESRNLRRPFFESLEERRLLAADVIPDCNQRLYNTARFAPWVTAADFQTCSSSGDSTATTSASSEGGDSAEGLFTAPLTWTEIEGNDTPATANTVPLTTASLTEVNGRITVGDLDYFKVHFNAGDIFSATVTGAGDLSLHNTAGVQIIGAQADENQFMFPATSPLLKGGNASMAATITTAGDYYFLVANGNSQYKLKLQVSRPVLEAEASGTHQVLFLDFDGGILDNSIFGSSGIARLTPLRNSLAGWGLGPENENEVIDAIIARTRQKMETEVRQLGANGSYLANGQLGSFDIEIRNSRDHADPWGQPNVSRVIIGGNGASIGYGPGLLGIAESVDVGNFDTTETAVTLLDPYIAAAGPLSVNSVLLGPGASKIELIGKLVGNTVVHEAGHFFGLSHTASAQTVRELMDQPPATFTLSLEAGVGADNRYGTADDIGDYAFTVDAYDTSTGFVGVQDALNSLSYVLASGRVATSISGTVWNDVNANGVLQTGERGLAGWTVFDDVNRNGFLDAREPSATTGADGRYTLFLPPGAHTISQVLPNNWTQTSPGGAANPVGVRTHSVSLTLGQSVSNISFGNRSTPNTISGFKWQDVNGNGVQDTGDAAQGGFTFYVDLDGNGRLDVGEPATVSGANGLFTITTSENGSFTLREAPKAGWRQTSPANGAGHAIQLTGGTILTGLSFGNEGPLFDFGDAPKTYSTLLANNGARALVLPGFHLGPSVAAGGVGVDRDVDGQPNVGANGDDAQGVDDEDGVVIGTLLVGQQSQLTVTATVASGFSAGYLQGWIDFNADGVWAAGEKIVSDRLLGNGVHTLNFTVPANAVIGPTYARFRYGYETGTAAGFVGAGNAGEVEDYLVTIQNNQPQANPDSATVNQNSTNNAINVLANDVASAGRQLSFVSVTSPTTAGGTVRIDGNNTATPTDDVLRFTPLPGFIGADTFQYTVTDGLVSNTAAVTVNVRSTLTDPVAVDDSFYVRPGTSGLFGLALDVLGNDFRGDNGPIRITGVNVPTGNRATVLVSNTGTGLTINIPAAATPSDEKFTYTIEDSSSPVPKTSIGTVTLHVGPSSSDDEVRFTIQAYDLQGNAIDVVQPGQEFELRMFAQDIRAQDDLTDQPTPIDERAVFAAYADLLYSSNLVAISGPVSFSPSFNLNRSSGLTVPGIIDDVGGSRTDAGQLPALEPQHVFSVKMRALQTGVAQFRTDPADVLTGNGNHQTLLYQTNRIVPYSRISYGEKSLIIGDPKLVLFKAIDDTAAVANGATSVTLPVMNNDLLAGDASATIVAIDQSGIGGDVTRSLDNKSLIYTPRTLTNVTEQFTYTLQSSTGVLSTATVTVNVGTTTGNDDVRIELRAFDMLGNPLTTVAPGAEFQIQASVTDLRQAAALKGLGAAFLDVIYDFSKVTVPLTNDPLGFEITFGPNFRQLTSGSAAVPGLLDEVGGFLGTATGGNPGPTGAGPIELFRVRFVANATASGVVNFLADPRDVSPLNDVLLYDPPSAVSVNNITFVSTSVTIGGSGEGEQFTNPNNPYDVNNDGDVSPLDALVGINALNTIGWRQLIASANAAGEGEAGGAQFVDVNGDGFHTAVDVLMVINLLNQASGEGEASAAPALVAASDSAPTLDSSVASSASAVSATNGPVAVRLLSAAQPASGIADARQVDETDEPFESLLECLALDVLAQGKHGSSGLWF